MTMPLTVIDVLRKSGLLFLGTIFISGCASSGYQDVKHNVEPRIGLPAHWYQGKAEDKSMFQKMEILLTEDMALDQTIEFALLNNPSLQATFEELGIAKADLIQATLFKNPQFDGHARVPQGGGPVNAELSVMQDFMDMLLMPLRRLVAQAQLDVIKLKVSQSVLDLVADVKKAYYELQLRQDNPNPQSTILKASEYALDLAERQYKAGNINSVELGQHKAFFEESKIQFMKSELDVRIAEESLSRLLGLKGKAIKNWGIKSKLDNLPNTDPSVENLELVALERRFDYQAAVKQIEVLNRSLMANRLGIIPSASAGYNAEREPEEPSPTWVQGPMWNVEVPLFDFKQAAISGNKARIRQAKQHVLALEVEILSQVRESRERMIRYRVEAERYRDHVIPVLQKLVVDLQLHYNFMLVGVYQLLQAKRDEVHARQEYTESLKNYWVSRTDLEKAIGGSFTQGFQEINIEKIDENKNLHITSEK